MIKFLMSGHLSISLTAWQNPTLAFRIFVKFYTAVFLLKSVEEIQFWFKAGKSKKCHIKNLHTFMTTLVTTITMIPPPFFFAKATSASVVGTIGVIVTSIANDFPGYNGYNHYHCSLLVLVTQLCQKCFVLQTCPLFVNL